MFEKKNQSKNVSKSKLCNQVRSNHENSTVNEKYYKINIIFFHSKQCLNEVIYF